MGMPVIHWGTVLSSLVENYQILLQEALSMEQQWSGKTQVIYPSTEDSAPGSKSYETRSHF
jgi:hypothetical protein